MQIQSGYNFEEAEIGNLHNCPTLPEESPVGFDSIAHGESLRHIQKWHRIKPTEFIARILASLF